MAKTKRKEEVVTSIPIPKDIHNLMSKFQKLEIRRYKTVAGKDGKKTTMAKLGVVIMREGFEKFKERFIKIEREVEEMEKIDKETIHNIIKRNIK